MPMSRHAGVMPDGFGSLELGLYGIIRLAGIET